MTLKITQKHSYLGDGLYAKNSDGTLVLYTGHHDYPDNIIYIELDVWINLEKFVKGELL